MSFSYDAPLVFQCIYTHLEFGFCCMKTPQILLAMRIFL